MILNTVSLNFTFCLNLFCTCFRHLNFRLCQSNFKVNKDRTNFTGSQIVNLMPCPMLTKGGQGFHFFSRFDRIKRVMKVLHTHTHFSLRIRTLSIWFICSRQTDCSYKVKIGKFLTYFHNSDHNIKRFSI